MSEILTLAKLNINVRPFFVRKINKKSYWIKTFDSSNRAEDIAKEIFTYNIENSLYLIDSDEDFYGFVASISSTRSPQNQNIDFVWMTHNDLNKAKVKYKQTSGGNCLAVQHLHYDAIMSLEEGISLCQELLNRNQDPLRCQKKQTKIILEYQTNKGCVAITDSTSCNDSRCI